MDTVFAVKVSRQDLWLISAVRAERAVSMCRDEDGRLVLSTTERPVLDAWTEALRSAGSEFEVLTTLIVPPAPTGGSELPTGLEEWAPRPPRRNDQEEGEETGRGLLGRICSTAHRQRAPLRAFLHHVRPIHCSSPATRRRGPRLERCRWGRHSRSVPNHGRWHGRPCPHGWVEGRCWNCAAAMRTACEQLISSSLRITTRS